MSFLLSTLSLLLAAQVDQFPQLFCRQFFKKALSLPCPCMNCQYSSCVLLVQSLITPLVTFADIPSAGSGPVSGCQYPCLTDSSAISFPSIPMCPGTFTSWILLCSVVSPAIDGSLRLIWNLSGSFQGP